MQLLKSNSLIENIEANIQPATGEGQSFLVVKVDEANPWVYGANVSNYDNVSTGAERFGVSLGYLNLTGSGDSVLASFNRAFDADTWEIDANYNLPINAKNGTLQLRTNIERNEIIAEGFEDLNFEGESELYEISFRQPLIRNLRKEFALSLGFSRQSSRNFINDVRLTEPTRTSVVKFGQDYTYRDPKGVWALRSQLNFGVDIFGTTVNNNNEQPDGLFFSWLGQAQRLQRLNSKNLLIIQSNIQFTPDNLLPSEQFTIGGAFSVRGYRQNARLGDNGLSFSVEDRISVVKNADNNNILQLAPFAELGVVWNNSSDDPDDNFLAGIGLGILWQPISDLDIRLDYAPPLVDLDDKGDNVQEDGFYFSINYNK
ncbi:MAG: ShlB/FhaC/HecB family hemolysin secretion/activation protein [Cyanobacteria bacterium P01_F01_bin.143]